MFQRLRRHLSYANMAATLAVVFAMSGGAYALSGGAHQPAGSANTLTAHVAKKVKKRSKRSVGTRGPAGPAGSAGPQGSAGVQGPVGEKGPAGEKGATGAAGKEGAAGAQGAAGPQGVLGAAGASVKASSFTGKLGSCSEGGSEFKIGNEQPTYACNGNAAEYPETLPAGHTETGVWSMSISDTGFEGRSEYYVGFADINFPLHVLQPNGHEFQVEIVPQGEANGTNPNCPSQSLNGPAASPGYLCLYTEEEYPEKVGFEKIINRYGPSDGSQGSLLFGVKILFANKTKPEGYADGVWAVTSE